MSFDQKPAWFNNTALDGSYSIRGYQPRIREVFAHCRQRFTLCTTVDSETVHQPETVPPLGVLFKAAPTGAVRRALEADPTTPEWMIVQTQDLMIALMMGHSHHHRSHYCSRPLSVESNYVGRWAVVLVAEETARQLLVAVAGEESRTYVDGYRFGLFGAGERS